MRLTSIGGLVVFILTAVCTFEALAEPVVPGFQRWHQGGNGTSEQRGELLIGELGCVNCHKANEVITTRLGTPVAPDLTTIGSRVTPQWLVNYLSDPHGTKPGGKMPDIFHASAPQAKAGAINYLVEYLVSRGGPIKPSKLGGTEATAERGKRLYHTIGCVACHSPENADGITTPIVPLPDLAAKTTVDQLMNFLLDPTTHRPSGRMPNMGLNEDDARAISVYLLRKQLENNADNGGKTASVEGLTYEYYEVSGNGTIPDFKSLTPKVTGVAKKIVKDVEGKTRTSNYAIKFSGTLTTQRAGNYRFWATSDDGSKIIINGQVVVNNDGSHGMTERNGRIRLTEGPQEIEIHYCQGGGGDGLRVQMAGPGIRRGEIPVSLLTTSSGKEMIPTTWTDFKPTPQNQMMGSRMFMAMRCVNCHAMPDARAISPAPSFSTIDVTNTAGCLGPEQSLSRRAPNYKLSNDQKSAIKAAVTSLQKSATPRTPAESVNHTLASLNCYACHNRDGIGGPDDARREFFTTTSEIDLGEEGIIPPTLNHAGAKFKPSAIKRIITSGELHVRHYMTTRMPMFDESVLGDFLTNLHSADKMDDLEKEPPFSPERIKAGQKFVGTTGVACITCHGIAGQKGLGIDGIDLSSAYQRLQPGWFKQFLLDPASFNKETRMPGFWPGGQSAFPDVLGGDSGAQIESIWTYLSLGSTMPLPKGIVPAGAIGMELVPGETPIIHRTFMEDVGPRSILTGYPEKLNIAFDANVVRLAKAWRGRFFDASGVASGRTDKFNKPLGGDVLDLPAGPAVALLKSPTDAWPTVEKTSRNIGGRFKGYSLNKDKAPSFQYELGGLKISETPQPVLEPGGPSLTRIFTIKGDADNGAAYLLLGEGEAIESQGNNTYLVNNKLTIKVAGSGFATPVIRELDGRKQLITRLQNSANIAANYKW